MTEPKEKEESPKKMSIDCLSKRQLLELDACTRCGECVVWCPVYDQDKKEELTPRAKARAFRRIINSQHGLRATMLNPEGPLARVFGTKGISLLSKLIPGKPVGEKEIEEFVKNLYECSTCGQCHEVCPSGIDTVPLWESIRSVIVDAGYGPLPNQKLLVTSVKAYDNPWQQPRLNRDKWARRAQKTKEIPKVPKDISKEKAEVLYFVGCTASYDLNIIQVAINTVKVLNACGVDFGILGNKEKCCGSVLLRVGDNEFERLAKENIEAFNNLGIKALITSCSGCYKTIFQDYPKVGKANFEVLHTLQYLKRLIDEGKMVFKREVPLKVTYHDPCHLGRAAGDFETARAILKVIPGVELVEMERIRENSRCCGAGGGLKAGYPDIQAKMAIRRVRDAEATGATHLVSACPFCYQGLQLGINAAHSSLKMADITELLIMAIEEESEKKEKEAVAQ